HEEALLVRATKNLEAIDGVTIYGAQPGKCPIVSFTAAGTHPYDIGMILDKQGIAVRTGTHCAEPLMTRFGLTGMARASFAVYNTLEEADVLAEGLRRALTMLR
ncbi:MAG: aminotransferase class V-fold PLP-dependent enzyme, partial [Rikenellaceae bacterium]|nr:aminotransferase class V-fold PLP-dependent enzyme [Rikenellaceae bacterium]